MAKRSQTHFEQSLFCALLIEKKKKKKKKNRRRHTQYLYEIYVILLTNAAKLNRERVCNAMYSFNFADESFARNMVSLSFQRGMGRLGVGVEEGGGGRRLEGRRRFCLLLLFACFFVSLLTHWF